MGWRSPLILQHHLEYRHIPEPLLAHVGLGEAHQRIKHCPCDPQNSVASPRHRASLAAQTLARQSIPDALLWFGDGWAGGYGQRCIFSFYFFTCHAQRRFHPLAGQMAPFPRPAAAQAGRLAPDTAGRRCSLRGRPTQAPAPRRHRRHKHTANKQTSKNNSTLPKLSA